MTRKINRVHCSVHTADGRSIIDPPPPPQISTVCRIAGSSAEYCHSLVFAIVQSGRKYHSPQRD